MKLKRTILGPILVAMFAFVLHERDSGRVVIARDRVCVGCGAPASRCQIHHIIFRSKHGRTVIENLVLVCWSCHHGLHHPAQRGRRRLSRRMRHAGRIDRDQRRAGLVAEVLNRIKAYYQPYHSALERAISERYEQFGALWHLNLHSMPGDAYERLGLRSDRPLADFVIGDRDGTTIWDVGNGNGAG